MRKQPSAQETVYILNVSEGNISVKLMYNYQRIIHAVSQVLWS